jgi:group II intron reverse transcriptase/maturase
MNDRRKSDSPIVPAKPPNKDGQRGKPSYGDPYTGTKVETPDTAKGPPTERGAEACPTAEVVEGRGLAKGNTDQQNARRTQSRTQRTSSALDRVRRVAKQDRKARFTALLHHVNIERLRAAYQALRRGAAAGVDGVTWQTYGQDLEANLHELHVRLHQGAYRARPSRRVYIPKADGRQRPLGIAALEDKIVQRAVVEVLGAIYEVDFLGFSYGFRPGRSQHDALDALTVGLKRRKVSWVLDADIRGFFDAIDHGWLCKFVEHRIADKRVLRLIQKWLRAGVMEDGAWTASEEGTPQGATISPLLANLYLHYVLDLWVQQWRRRRARGDMIIVRFADDFIVGFEHRSDAEQFLEDLRERLAKFALELHADKTRLLEFGRHADRNRRARGLGRPETFDFLGFTHMCAKTEKGRFMLKRTTISKRMRTKLREVKTELMRRRHRPVPEQGHWLASVVRGHLAYYAVPGNIDAVAAFRTQAMRHWYRALRRRSQRSRLDWKRMDRLSTRWLPLARKKHPWPEDRFDGRTRGRSPVR